MAFKDIWRPRVDGVDDADSSAVNEIAKAVIDNENAINEMAVTFLTDVDKRELENKIDAVEQEFNSVVGNIDSINIFNAETAEKGCFYKYNSSTNTMEKMDNVNMACVKQAVEGGKVYTCSRIDYIVYFLKADGTKTGNNLNTSATGLKSFTFEVPSDASYVCLSWNHTKLSETQYMIVEGNNLPQKYVEYSTNCKEIKPDVKIHSESIVYETYTVALDGTGDFTSFSGCLLALKDNTNPKTIYVKAGTYDVFEEIGGADFCATIESGTNWRDCSVLVPDNTKIIGVGMVELVFRPTLEQIGEVAGYLLSPINVKYNAEFENISINSCNCRYAIHSDDRENNANPIRQIYRNVRIKHQRIDIGNAAGFGAGTANGNNYIFENCNFEAWTPLSFHNNGSWEIDGTQIILNNCIFKTTLPSEYPSINFGNVNPKQVRIDVRLSGCYLNGNINIRNETSGAERPNAFAIEALNCSNFEVNCTCATNIYEPVVF